MSGGQRQRPTLCGESQGARHEVTVAPVSAPNPFPACGHKNRAFAQISPFCSAVMARCWVAARHLGPSWGLPSQLQLWVATSVFSRRRASCWFFSPSTPDISAALRDDRFALERRDFARGCRRHSRFWLMGAPTTAACLTAMVLTSCSTIVLCRSCIGEVCTHCLGRSWRSYGRVGPVRGRWPDQFPRRPLPGFRWRRLEPILHPGIDAIVVNPIVPISSRRPWWSPRVRTWWCALWPVAG